MTLGELIKVRDATIINQLVVQLELSEVQELELVKAVTAGGRRWDEEHLPNIVGQEVAENILAKPVVIEGDFSQHGIAPWEMWLPIMKNVQQQSTLCWSGLFYTWQPVLELTNDVANQVAKITDTSFKYQMQLIEHSVKSLGTVHGSSVDTDAKKNVGTRHTGNVSNYKEQAA